MKNSAPCLSVVVPCYNEEATIVQILNRLLRQIEVGQVIIVDDNSIDSSRLLIESVNDPRIMYLKNQENRGKGASVSRGLSMCIFPYILIQDADLEYSPEEIPRLLAPLIDGRADAVFGSRFLTYEARRALYYWHRVGNSFLTILSNMFSNLDLTDMETGYKAMKLSFAQNLNIQEKRFGIEPEITAKLSKMNARVYEVPISYQGRTYEEGKKITWKDGFRAIYAIIK
jgi:glycosyltransferase involved in cell wall biosynthesis